MNSLHASFWDGRKNVVVIIFDCSILEPAGFVYLSSAGMPAEMVPPPPHSLRTKSSIRGCVFRLRDRLGMGIISSRGRLGAPQGPQINFGKISTQLGLEESSKPAEKAICNLGDRSFES